MAGRSATSGIAAYRGAQLLGAGRQKRQRRIAWLRAVMDEVRESRASSAAHLPARETDASLVCFEAHGENAAPELPGNLRGAPSAREFSEKPEIFGGPEHSFSTSPRHNNSLKLWRRALYRDVGVAHGAHGMAPAQLLDHIVIDWPCEGTRDQETVINARHALTIGRGLPALRPPAPFSR